MPLELAFSPWVDVPEAATWIALTVCAVLLLHLRTVGWRRDTRRLFCGGCGYPEAGMPTDAVCPECGGAFAPKTARRVIRYDRRGAAQSLLIVFAFVGSYASSPMVWAAWYRADGWLRMRAIDRPCMFRTSFYLSLGLALMVVFLPLFSRGRDRGSWIPPILIALVVSSL